MNSNSIHQRGMVGSLIALILLGVRIGPALGETPRQPEPPNEALRYADALSQAFEYAAETIRPSVVAIHSIKHLQPQGRSDGGQIPLPRLPEGFPFDDDLLRRFFGGHLPQFPQDVPPQEGLGSGVIVSADGYVLTNNQSSSGGESHPSALTEPDVKLSPHPALTLQPPVSRRVPTERTTWGPAARCSPASASTHALVVETACTSVAPLPRGLR
jgi:hypothetical protein